MKKIAVFNDLSGLGKCSLTAAVPVISAMGVQACPLPTAILSNQTGYDSYFIEDYTPHMPAIINEWKKRGFCPDGIYSGFLGSEQQVSIVLDFIRDYENGQPMILVDPVMGDSGCTYSLYSGTFLERMRTLVRAATVITPNLTEALLLLYGKKRMQSMMLQQKSASPDETRCTVSEAGRALQESFAVPTVIITGVELHEHPVPYMGVFAADREDSFWEYSEKIGGSYSGTGDLFASVLVAGLVQGIPVRRCVAKAVSFLSKGITDAVRDATDPNDGICFEAYLHELYEETTP